MLKVQRLRVQGIGDWLSAADPGYIRIQLGLRAALATLTTMLVMLVISNLLTGAPTPAMGLFGALMCFLAFWSSTILVPPTVESPRRWRFYL